MTTFYRTNSGEINDGYWTLDGVTASPLASMGYNPLSDTLDLADGPTPTTAFSVNTSAPFSCYRIVNSYPGSSQYFNVYHRLHVDEVDSVTINLAGHGFVQYSSGSDDFCSVSSGSGTAETPFVVPLYAADYLVPGSIVNTGSSGRVTVVAVTTDATNAYVQTSGTDSAATFLRIWCPNVLSIKRYVKSATSQITMGDSDLNLWDIVIGSCIAATTGTEALYFNFTSFTGIVLVNSISGNFSSNGDQSIYLNNVTVNYISGTFTADNALVDNTLRLGCGINADGSTTIKLLQADFYGDSAYGLDLESPGSQKIETFLGNDYSTAEDGGVRLNGGTIDLWVYSAVPASSGNAQIVQEIFLPSLSYYIDSRDVVLPDEEDVRLDVEYGLPAPATQLKGSLASSGNANNTSMGLGL